MITIKRTHGGDVLLMKTILRQKLETTGYAFRQVRRTDIGKVFRQHPDALDGIIQATLPGKYAGEPYHTDVWPMRVFPAGYQDQPMYMMIGCCYFDAIETAKIRRWALRKRKV